LGIRRLALQEYATDILGNKSVLRILKTLLRYKGKILTIRELAATSNLSHPEVSALVKTLESRRIVSVQYVGRAHQVSLNENSYFLKSIVEPLFLAEKNTLSSLIATIKRYFSKDKRFLSVAIFGSVARGLEKATSDIDLLVITEHKDDALTSISRANSTVISKFGHAISPLIMTKEELLQKNNSALVKSIVDAHLQVSGKDLGEIVSNVRKAS
jgi:predicted nucleotidyltransferase